MADPTITRSINRRAPIITAQGDTVDFIMMYATHNAFRRALGRLIEAANGGKGDTPQVRDGWENFKIQLLLHHSVEDASAWPRLRVVLADRPGDLVLVNEMETEHGQLEPALAAVDAFGGGRPSPRVVT